MDVRTKNHFIKAHNGAPEWCYGDENDYDSRPDIINIHHCPTPGPILRANWAGHPRPDFQCHFWHRVQVIWCVLVSNDNFRLVLRTKMCLNSILIIFSNLWVPSATCPIWELACSKFWGLPWCQDGNVKLHLESSFCIVLLRNPPQIRQQQVLNI